MPSFTVRSYDNSYQQSDWLRDGQPGLDAWMDDKFLLVTMSRLFVDSSSLLFNEYQGLEVNFFSMSVAHHALVNCQEK
jgi:hypothetical protein